MAPVTNGRHLFNEEPTGYPVPGKTTVYDATQKIDLETVPLNGGFLIKVLALSIDPYIRGRMRQRESYIPSFQIGQPLENHGIGVVIRSENPAVRLGDHILGFFNFEEYLIKSDLTNLRIVKNEEKLPWSVYLGAAGMPGRTAYNGWKEYARPIKGDVVFVTTGSGPVGSLVAQLAKLDGLKVIASAGSDAKVAFMKEIGVDVAFNYKTTDTRKVLEKEGPINIYWDNVGGEMLEAALDAAAPGARFIECGMIHGYNTTPHPIKNLFLIIAKMISMYGMQVTPLDPKYIDEFYKTIPPLLASGKLKYLEDITQGLDKAGDAILAVQVGTNHGKSVIAVSDE